MDAENGLRRTCDILFDYLSLGDWNGCDQAIKYLNGYKSKVTSEVYNDKIYLLGNNICTLCKTVTNNAKKKEIFVYLDQVFALIVDPKLFSDLVTE